MNDKSETDVALSAALDEISKYAMAVDAKDLSTPEWQAEYQRLKKKVWRAFEAYDAEHGIEAHVALGRDFVMDD
jgi:hypothetical protein